MFKKEESYGVIPLKRLKGEGWAVLVVQHNKGHWAFPKGHAEGDEEAVEAAARELFEETGLVVDEWLPLPPLQESYSFDRENDHTDKRVTYFAATVSGDIVLQQEEVVNAIWMALEEAQERITFPEAKELCSKVIASL
ncbi:NUDIX domain-containing protein [Simkania negevensis]|uniref:NUDIX domain-containing protein n=1 Tax=Simkania negevensis TaxID=83561 RepID=A0ABS3ARG1_9BACT|nr:NUDIX domain-containing protein [Simkania negevensis]